MDDDTSLAAHYRFMARYNRWFNQRLYDACEQLTDDQRKQHRGAFFGSIHNTLNHIVLGDQGWLRRFSQCARDHGQDITALAGNVLELPETYTLDQVLYEDWAALRAKRAQLDEAVEAWLRDLPPGATQ